jgi:hypothetical protein
VLDFGFAVGVERPSLPVLGLAGAVVAGALEAGAVADITERASAQVTNSATHATAAERTRCTFHAPAPRAGSKRPRADLARPIMRSGSPRGIR